MRLSKDEVKKIAGLARIDLSEPEVARFQGELSTIIDYNAKQLSKVSKAPEVNVSGTSNFGQADEPRPSLPVDLAISNAPLVENGFFVVPKVLEE